VVASWMRVSLVCTLRAPEPHLPAGCHGRASSVTQPHLCLARAPPGARLTVLEALQQEKDVRSHELVPASSFSHPPHVGSLWTAHQRSRQPAVSRGGECRATRFRQGIEEGDSKMARAYRSVLASIAILVILLGVAGCGGSVPSSASGSSSPNPSTVSGRDQSPSGDIPDTATFLAYHSSHYSMQYVEGWVQQVLAGDGVQFADKDSFVRVTLQPLPSSSVKEYAAGPGAAQSAQEFQQFANAKVTSVALPAGNAALVTFEALSASDPVTGKRVTLAYNRYYIPGLQGMAVLTQATPLGVDNFDAFLQIAKSFVWS
jgi:hypothetical protein